MTGVRVTVDVGLTHESYELDYQNHRPLVSYLMMPDRVILALYMRESIARHHFRETCGYLHEKVPALMRHLIVNSTMRNISIRGCKGRVQYSPFNDRQDAERYQGMRMAEIWTDELNGEKAELANRLLGPYVRP